MSSGDYTDNVTIEESDDSWIAEHNWRGCTGDGNSPQEARSSLEDAVEDHRENINKLVTETPPSYSIVPVVRTPQINPGDAVEVAIYCTGIGACEYSKLFLNFYNPSVFIEENALLNPQKASGAGHSVFGSGPLPRECRDRLLVEREKIEIPRWIDPTP